MKDENKSFLGTGWSFPPSFNKERHTVDVVSEKEDIDQSIKIIIKTIPGERMMFPKFGCAIHKFVFDTNDVTTRTMLRDVIYDALLFHEPRIVVEDIHISEENTLAGDNYISDSYQLNGKLHIHVNYRIIITNSRSNVVFPYYHKEGSNI